MRQVQLCGVTCALSPDSGRSPVPKSSQRRRVSSYRQHRRKRNADAFDEISIHNEEKDSRNAIEKRDREGLDGRIWGPTGRVCGVCARVRVVEFAASVHGPPHVLFRQNVNSKPNVIIRHARHRTGKVRIVFPL